jgi:hypothetical protein
MGWLVSVSISSLILIPLEKKSADVLDGESSLWDAVEALISLDCGVAIEIAYIFAKLPSTSIDRLDCCKMSMPSGGFLFDCCWV